MRRGTSDVQWPNVERDRRTRFEREVGGLASIRDSTERGIEAVAWLLSSSSAAGVAENKAEVPDAFMSVAGTVVDDFAWKMSGPGWRRDEERDSPWNDEEFGELLAQRSDWSFAPNFHGQASRVATTRAIILQEHTYFSGSGYSASSSSWRIGVLQDGRVVRIRSNAKMKSHKYAWSTITPGPKWRDAVDPVALTDVAVQRLAGLLRPRGWGLQKTIETQRSDAQM